MYKWIICLSFLLGFGTVQAHQPDLSSTMLVEQGENKWVLQIRAALTAFEYEVQQHFGKAAYATPEEFRELVIQHLEKNVSILFNEDHPVVLKNGLVKLGHETTATFEVVGTPANMEALKVVNKSFSDISRNQSALIIIKKGFAKDQFTLNNNNEHTVDLKVGDAKFVEVNPIQEKTSYTLWIAIGVGLILTILYFVFKNKKKRNLEIIPIPSNV